MKSALTISLCFMQSISNPGGEIIRGCGVWVKFISFLGFLVILFGQTNYFGHIISLMGSLTSFTWFDTAKRSNFSFATIPGSSSLKMTTLSPWSLAMSMIAHSPTRSHMCMTVTGLK